MREGETTPNPCDRDQQSGRNDNLASHLRALPLDAVQQPEDVDIPVDEDVPVVEDSPVVEHGVVLNVELGVGMVGTGLRPPAPSSVEPKGTPIRPMVDAEPIVGEEADPAGPAKELIPVSGQVPDALPAVPPPSNTVLEVEVPGVEMPVPTEVPVAELPMSDDELPMPDDIPVAGLPGPNDVSGIEPPKPRHPEAVAVAGPSGDAPDVIGLRPGEANSVAPRGMRTGGTGAAGPMPSGDVMPSGEGESETCATAGLQTKSTAAVVAITKRAIRFNLILTLELVVRPPAHQPRNQCNHALGDYFSRIAAIGRILLRSELAG
jgi:hypothetical protein